MAVVRGFGGIVEVVVIELADTVGIRQVVDDVTRERVRRTIINVGIDVVEAIDPSEISLKYC